MEDTNWKGATEQINLLEGKLQQAVNENAKLNVTQNKGQGLDSEMWDKCSETLHQLATHGENHKQHLLAKILTLESHNQEFQGKVYSASKDKTNSSESLQGEIARHEQQALVFENQIKQLGSVVNEKEQLYSCTVERELEDQKIQVAGSLALVECQLSKAKKQYHLMLEGQHIELSNHLKDICVENDKVINELCKKYEPRKTEIGNAEKEKAEKQSAIPSECSENISKNKQDFESYLVLLKEEHGTMVERIQQDNEHKESTLWSYHKEELQRIQSHAENELQRLSLLRTKTENELQTFAERQRALLQVMGENQQVDQEVNSKKVERIQQDNEHKESTLWSYHKEELQRIQSHAENELQRLSLLRTKTEHELQIFEERQRALLQVMGENQQVDQEVNSKKEDLITLKKLRDPCRSKGHELSTNSVRSLHGTATRDSGKKRKDPINQNYPGNTATVVLDPDHPEASLCSYKRAIRKARAWCRSTTKPIDISSHFGPGAEAFTTPSGGTFHLTFVYNNRRLTLFLYGRDLYVKGWHSEKNGTFQIEKGFILDPKCRFADTGVNYNDLCPQRNLALVRVGLGAFIESFEVVDKCDGLVTTGLVQSIAMFCVGTSEAIRLQDVFNGIVKSFVDYPYLGPDALFWIRKYGFYSGQYLKYLDKILSGKQPPKILNRSGGNITCIHELRQRIRVPLRDSLPEGETIVFEKPETPVWSPPYADGKDWDDKQLDKDDEKYWPNDGAELEDEEYCESEEEKEIELAENVKGSNDEEEEDEDSCESEEEKKDNITGNRSSIFRFSTVVSPQVDLLGRYGFLGAINSVGNTSTIRQPFLTASSRMKVEVKSSFFWRFSGWKKLQLFTKFLNKFK